jgi:hypothetical protein
MNLIASAATVLAHQGGWDEVALIGGPILVIIVLLAIAKRRVDAQTARHQAAKPSDHDPT